MPRPRYGAGSLKETSTGDIGVFRSKSSLRPFGQTWPTLRRGIKPRRGISDMRADSEVRSR